MPEPSLSAINALLDCPVTHTGPWPDLAPLLEVVERATGADAVVLAVGGQPVERSLVASTGLPPAQAHALSADARKLLAAAADVPTDLDGTHLGAAHPLPGRTEGAIVLVGEPQGAHVATILRVAAERVAGALEAGRLRSDLERAMAQILESDERLLGRIGLDIHDGPTQHLSVALLELQLLDGDLADVDADTLPPSLKPALERIYETLGGALTEMRELIGHLRPAQFEDRRLVDILRDAITGFEARSGATVTTDMRGEFAVNGVSITQRITLYRILQEALGNAYRHGRSQNAHVTVVEDEQGIAMEVRDDGAGFDAEAALKPRSGAPIARFGLHGMRDRSQVLGGTFSVTSVIDEGTTVRVFLPRWLPPQPDDNR